MHFLGLDVGTSAVKAVLVDENEAVIAEASAPLSTTQPRQGWSEQEPEDWWRATGAVVASVKAWAPAAFRRIEAVGLAGQMHGAVILDEADMPIRPAILWNDGRATAECAALEAEVPGLPTIAGVIAMPGFTAPKLRWLRDHEPDAFRRTRKILLAKDFVRLRLTGESATDMCDAAGTLLLNEATRDWSDAIIAATGLTRAEMPRLLEGSAPSGMIGREILAKWGIDHPVIVAAGAGDAAAGAIGIGAIEDGDAFISLGTSAQFFVTRDRYEPKPATLIHAFAHALPGRWFEMAAMLNGATVLDWAARLVGEPDIAALLTRVEATFTGPSRVVFLPYLSGERTPHNDADARGVFFGLDAATTREELIQAVLEGVVLSFMDAKLALGAAGLGVDEVAAVGGGAQSRFWMRLIASGLGIPVLRGAGAGKGPAFGAARLARLALTGESPESVCTKPAKMETIEPDAALGEAYRERFALYRRLYANLKRVRRPLTDRR